MTVAELIEKLGGFDHNLKVVINEDGLDRISIYDPNRDDGQVGEIVIPPDHL